ncbi:MULTISPECIES: hypothetical protein [unclassified Pseudomonas]|uniref:hypothetical protein n=1 Tax=unclassified Pseudomonas TaxID=196821 RepID=UPI0013581C7A|nr:hypothetical protein [Pseudomonas sp. R84]
MKTFERKSIDRPSLLSDLTVAQSGVCVANGSATEIMVNRRYEHGMTDMSKNFLQNGNFSTGKFAPWEVHVFQGKASVVQHNLSAQAKVLPGVDTGVVLLNKFTAPPGAFTIKVDASAPGAEYHQDPPNIDTHPILFFFISGYNADGKLVQFDVGNWWLKPKQKSFIYSGVMLTGVVEVELQVSFPSDPLQVKGSLYIDNVSYSLDSPGSIHTTRWSQ